MKELYNKMVGLVLLCLASLVLMTPVQAADSATKYVSDMAKSVDQLAEATGVHRIRYIAKKSEVIIRIDHGDSVELARTAQRIFSKNGVSLERVSIRKETSHYFWATHKVRNDAKERLENLRFKPADAYSY